MGVTLLLEVSGPPGVTATVRCAVTATVRCAVTVRAALRVVTVRVALRARETADRVERAIVLSVERVTARSVGTVIRVRNARLIVGPRAMVIVRSVVTVMRVRRAMVIGLSVGKEIVRSVVTMMRVLRGTAIVPSVVMGRPRAVLPAMVTDRSVVVTTHVLSGAAARGERARVAMATRAISPARTVVPAVTVVRVPALRGGSTVPTRVRRVRPRIVASADRRFLKRSRPGTCRAPRGTSSRP